MRRPNILFIMTDDQGPWAYGATGDPNAKTPNLDRLANDGARLTNYFCMSPVCSAARACLSRRGRSRASLGFQARGQRRLCGDFFLVADPPPTPFPRDARVPTAQPAYPSHDEVRPVRQARPQQADMPEQKAEGAQRRRRRGK